MIYRFLYIYWNHLKQSVIFDKEKCDKETKTDQSVAILIIDNDSRVGRADSDKEQVGPKVQQSLINRTNQMKELTFNQESDNPGSRQTLVVRLILCTCYLKLRPLHYSSYQINK